MKLKSILAAGYNMKTSIAEYNKLPEIEKRILQLKSLCRPGLSITDLLRVVNSSDIKTTLTKAMIYAAIKQILDGAVSKKILTKELRFSPAILHYISIDATSGETAANNIKAIVATGTLGGDYLRFAIYVNDNRLFNESINFRLGDNTKLATQQKIVREIAGYFHGASLDESWLDKLKPNIQCVVMAACLYNLLHTELDYKYDIGIFRKIINSQLSSWQVNIAFITDLFVEFFFLTGEVEKIRVIASSLTQNPVKYNSLLGILAFLEDQNAQSISYFDYALTLSKAETKKKNLCLSATYGVFHIFALLKAGNQLAKIKLLLKYHNTLSAQYEKELRQSQYGYSHASVMPTSKYFSTDHAPCYARFELLVKFLEYGLTRGEKERLSGRLLPFDILQSLLLSLWCEVDQQQLQNLCDTACQNYAMLPGAISIFQNIKAILTNDMLEVLNPYKIDFTKLITVKPEWERTMEALEGFLSTQTHKKSLTKRLVWLLYPERSYDRIEPIEQTRNNNGGWSKGRPASLKRLHDSGYALDYLSHQDKQVLKHVERVHYYSNSYELNQSKSLIALENHPLIFHGNTGEHLELVAGSPELVVKESNDNYEIQLSEYATSDTVKLKKETDSKYQVINISGPILEIMKIVGLGFKVPKAAKEQLLSFVEKSAVNINVRTELNDDSLEGEPGDTRIIVQLAPIDSGIKIRMQVRPFGEFGPYYSPGIGNKSVVANIQNSPKKVIRNLLEEKKNAKNLLSFCTSLTKSSNYEWKIEELEDTLEVLYELNYYKTKHNIIIEWPQGQSLFIDQEISFQDLKLNIKTSNQWFEFDGEVELQENQVLQMRSLLSKLSSAKGRFIELSDNRFVALTDGFLKRIQELRTAAKITEHGQSIHKLGFSLLTELSQGAKSFKSDKNWKEHIEKISLSQKYEPQVPKGLQAELRPYQLDGYKWLSRLLYLGFGACLADDMGLGKTVQTIALLLEQATLGPCLVIAPASVCAVWEEECKKFAPTLNCKIISQSNREEQIQNLTKMDILVCSYGMLYQIEEVITAKSWQVAVLDEAQAIKNINTKRFKIALELKAEHRIALSGTPVENHTEELWNLFEFLNPGFLGSRQNFQDRYTKPQEEQIIIARNSLKNLIQPFILRRTKDKVLAELPPKTEQTILIEPSQEEKNFYEALRRESLERISGLEEASAAKKRFSILAEITKLRRACCDASLVNSEIEVPNSKLEALDGIIKDLKENNHRALIFSQYVDYLKIVKTRLDKQNVTYQYLDGSTPQKQRQKSVQNFQAGEGELFLISLKAGGVGLNLTGADYVVHLDPWWNPAVEDQASDRAHRIGQTRPVTIYRLVMKHSIEEKILKVHQEKRELAFDLLSDSDKSANLTENDLIKLLIM